MRVDQAPKVTTTGAWSLGWGFLRGARSTTHAVTWGRSALLARLDMLTGLAEVKAEVRKLASYQKEAPRLCRGGSRSLTFEGVVHRRDFQS